MLDFLQVVSNVAYVFFIISAIVFGISFAVKFLIINTVKKVNAESVKNFEKIEDINKKSKSLQIINRLNLRYVNYLDESRVIKKIKRRNKVRALFKLKQKKVPVASDNLKDVFLSLFKDLSECYEGSGGYLNFTKNEILDLSRKLNKRLGELVDSSGVIWLKSIKISFFVEAIKLYGNFEKFKAKPSVIIVTGILNFLFAITRFFSPVSATKKLAGNIMNDNFITVITSAIISIVGQELSSLLYEKEKSRQKLLSQKNY